MKLILIMISFLMSFNGFSETLLTSKQFLKANLSKSAKMSREKFQVTTDMLKKAKSVAKNADEKQSVFYFGKSESGKLEKACTIVPQIGKEAPMTLGVCFDDNGLITEIDILEFGEERGQKARDRSFLDQFKGKGNSAKLSVGVDIHAVSGATYTSEYISEAIRKASFYHSQFIKGRK